MKQKSEFKYYSMLHGRENVTKYPIFIKFMKKEHVKSFVEDGRLWMGSYEIFRKTEDMRIRGDKLEGCNASFQAKAISLEIAGKKIIDLIDRVNIRPKDSDHCHIFCLTALSFEDFEASDGRLVFDKRFKGFGDKAVIIHNPEIFLQQTVNACIQEPNILRYTKGKVEYLPQHYNGILAPFQKLDEYSWQKEFRIAIYKEIPNPSVHHQLSIGSIKSISKTYDTDFLVENGLPCSIEFSS